MLLFMIFEISQQQIDGGLPPNKFIIQPAIQGNKFTLDILRDAMVIFGGNQYQTEFFIDFYLLAIEFQGKRPFRNLGVFV